MTETSPPADITGTFRTLDSCEINHQRVLLRADLNVPLSDGVIQDDTRLTAILPTLNHLIDGGAKVRVISHFGRPVEGEFDARYSLAPVAERLSQLLKRPVTFVTDWIDGIDSEAGDLVLCENVRFLKGEKANDSALAEKMAALCDVYVMDAFATAHRAQASTHGVSAFAPVACAGPLLVREINALQKLLHAPKRPLLAIVGGSKVSTKLNLLQAVLQQADGLIVGGGIANTFLAAQGHPVGQSLYEADFIVQAQALLAMAKTQNKQIYVPSDVRVGQEFSADCAAQIKACMEVSATDRILDVGPETSAQYQAAIAQAGTILWNGPLGVFEFPAFKAGTEQLAKDIAASEAYTVAGGGDTLAAIAQFVETDDISYISTGGGAFLAFLENGTLPALQALAAHYARTA